MKQNEEFMVRRRKVQKALEWLKQNNPAFSDITISQDRLQMLPENGELQISIPWSTIQTPLIVMMKGLHHNK